MFTGEGASLGGWQGTGEQGLWLQAQGTHVSPTPRTDMQGFIKERQIGGRGRVGQLPSDSIFPRNK